MSTQEWSEQDDGPIHEAFFKSVRRSSQEAILTGAPSTLAHLLARICLHCTVLRHGGIILHNNKRCIALEFYRPMKVDVFPALSVQFCISNTLRQAKFFLRDEKFEILECTSLFDAFLEHLKMYSRCQRVTDVVSGAVLWDGAVVGFSKVDSRKKGGSRSPTAHCNHMGNTKLSSRFRHSLSAILDMLEDGMHVTSSQARTLCALSSIHIGFILLNAIQALYCSNTGSIASSHLHAVPFLSQPWFQTKVLGDLLFQLPYYACALLQLNAEDCLPCKTLSLLFLGFTLSSNFPVVGTLLLNPKSESYFIWLQSMSQLIMTVYISVVTFFYDKKKT